MYLVWDLKQYEIAAGLDPEGMAGASGGNRFPAGTAELCCDDEAAADWRALRYHKVDRPGTPIPGQGFLGGGHRPDRVVVQPHHNRNHTLDLFCPGVVPSYLDAGQELRVCAKPLLRPATGPTAEDHRPKLDAWIRDDVRCVDRDVGTQDLAQLLGGEVRIAVELQPAVVEHQGAMTQLLDLPEAVRHEQDRAVLALELGNLGKALAGEMLVAHGQYFVNQQDVRVDVHRDREAQAHIHARRV